MLEPIDQPEVKKAALEDQQTDAGTVCLNCESGLMGDFCHRCGQKSDVKPFNWRTLSAHFYQSFRKIDSEIRNTFLALLLRPGEFCREYLAGKRKAYTDPVKYFFFCFVLQVSVFGFIRYFSANPEIDEAAKVSTTMQLLIMVCVFLWAISYTVVFRRSGFNLAENMVCMLFLTSESRIFNVILQLLFLPLSIFTGYDKEIFYAVVAAVSLLYAVFFSRQFYGEPLGRTVLKNLLVTFIFAIIFVPFLFLELLVTVLAGIFTK